MINAIKINQNINSVKAVTNIILRGLHLSPADTTVNSSADLSSEWDILEIFTALLHF